MGRVLGHAHQWVSQHEAPEDSLNCLLEWLTCDLFAHHHIYLRWGWLATLSSHAPTALMDILGLRDRLLADAVFPPRLEPEHAYPCPPQPQAAMTPATNGGGLEAPPGGSATGRKTTGIAQRGGLTEHSTPTHSRTPVPHAPSIPLRPCTVTFTGTKQGAARKRSKRSGSPRLQQLRTASPRPTTPRSPNRPPCSDPRKLPSPRPAAAPVPHPHRHHPPPPHLS